MRKITLNEDDMREPCEHNNLATCGHCNRSWCDTCNPTPSARCPFEYEHEHTDEPDPELQWGEESAKFQASLNEHEHEYDEDQEFAAFLANNDIKIDPNTPLAPHGGCNWSGCTTCFPPKDRLDEDYLNKSVPRTEEDVLNYLATNSEVRPNWWTDQDEANYRENSNLSRACPICGEYGGSHNDDMHRKDIDPKYLKEKGWHHDNG